MFVTAGYWQDWRHWQLKYFSLAAAQHYNDVIIEPQKLPISISLLVCLSLGFVLWVFIFSRKRKQGCYYWYLWTWPGWAGGVGRLPPCVSCQHSVAILFISVIIAPVLHIPSQPLLIVLWWFPPLLHHTIKQNNFPSLSPEPDSLHTIVMNTSVDCNDTNDSMIEHGGDLFELCSVLTFNILSTIALLLLFSILYWLLSPL